jgi:Ulp1 family protease
MMMQTLRQKLPLDNGWSMEELAVPQQRNNDDCGVFCCQFMKFAALGKQIPIWKSEGDIILIRKMMAVEIYEGRLRWFT